MVEGGLTSKNIFLLMGQETVPENENDKNSKLPLDTNHVPPFELENKPSRKNSHLTNEKTEALKD